jgi:uncharacterized phage infection (PIP) family protein YhgE
MLQGINETLAERMAENVGRAVSQALTPVGDSMDRFIIGATRNQIDGVNHIVGRFLEEMDRRMGHQFVSLAGGMSALADAQGRAAQQTGETLANAGEIVRNARSLQEMSSHILDKFEAYMSTINEVRIRDATFESRSSELMNRMNQQNRELEGLLNGLAEKIRDLKTENKSEGDSLKGLRDLTAQMNESVRGIQRTLNELAREE